MQMNHRKYTHYGTDKFTKHILKAFIIKIKWRHSIQVTGQFYKTSWKHIARQSTNTAYQHEHIDAVDILRQVPLEYY